MFWVFIFMTFHAQNFICGSAVSHPVEMGLQLLSRVTFIFAFAYLSYVLVSLLFIALVPYDLSSIKRGFQVMN